MYFQFVSVSNTKMSKIPHIDEFMENEQKKEDQERTKVQAQQDRHQPLKGKTTGDDEPKVEEISKIIDNLPDK
uniref:Uncharacterized protein n=1 Tax=Panagrolaimus sp. PS1159 TaxID=55785 RepID=A0AC35F6P6_9BILA